MINREPDILLLDEATSALDTHSEALVQVPAREGRRNGGTDKGGGVLPGEGVGRAEGESGLVCDEAIGVEVCGGAPFARLESFTSHI